MGERPELADRRHPGTSASTEFIFDRARPHATFPRVASSINLAKAARGRHLPAIALTAYAAAEDRRRTLQAGYDSHVAKPVEATVFAPLIASLLPGGRHA